MKKILVLAIIILFTLFFYKNQNIEESIIPDDAIRFRVIASSNTVYDQNVKIQIRNVVQNKLFDLTNESNNIQKTRKIINENLDSIKEIVNNKIKELNYDKDFKINYGLNYFPEKKYKGVKYKEGNYESLVITLGDGEGDNWWCVLFPPLCLIESEEQTSSSSAEYKFFIKEIINKYIS